MAEDMLIDLLRKGCIDPERRFYGHRMVCQQVPSAGARGAAALRQVNATLARARVFHLDDAVTDLAARLSMDSAVALAARLPLTRAPYPVTWMEWRESARLAPLAASGYSRIPEDGEDGRAGFLLEALDRGGESPLYRLSVWSDIFSTADIDPGARLPEGVSGIGVGFLFDPLSAQLHDRLTPAERVFNEEMGAIETFREGAGGALAPGRLPATFAFGGPFVLRALSQPAQEAAYRRLARHVRYVLTPPFGSVVPEFAEAAAARQDTAPAEARRVLFRSMVEECAGDMRFLIALLALLNTQPLTEAGAPWAPIGRMTVRGRKLRYLERRRVRLTVPRSTALASVRASGAGRPRRAHEVRGTMCHSRDTDRSCIHDWQPQTANREVCTCCGGRRWWRRPHQRGDARLGLVLKDYRVEHDGALRQAGGEAGR